MFEGERALEVHDIRRTDRTVSGHFDRGALYEGAGCHEDGIDIAGHRAGHRGRVGVDRRPALDSFGESAHVFFAVQSDRRDEVGAEMPRLRRHGKAELLEDGGAEFRCHHSLTGHVRRKEEAFKERTIGSRVGAHLVPKARDSELMRAALYEIFSAADVSTGRCKSAAGILDKGAGGDVCAELDRFFFVGKFAVAVVHEADGLRVLCFDDVDDLPDVFREEGVSEAVAARTLDFYELGVLIDHGGDTFQIIGVAFERHFLVVDTARLQISRSVAGNADDALHGVIGSADGGEHGIARFEEGEEYGA